MIDNKASIDDVNRALAEVSRELDAKATLPEVRKLVRDAGEARAAIVADVALARWVWKSGVVKSGNAVPWNVQAINTDPDNFAWEKDKVCMW